MPTSLAERPAASAPPLRRPSLYRIERAYIYLVLGAVSMNWPWNWFANSTPLDLANIDSRGTILFAGLFLVSSLIVVVRWSELEKIARGEPALLLLLLLALMSTLWSDQPDIALRRSSALALSASFGFYLAIRVPLPTIIRMVAWVLFFRALIDYVMIFGLPEFGVDPNGQWEGRAPGKNNLGRDGVVAALVMTWQVIAHRSARFVFLVGVILAFGLVLGSNSTTALVSAVLLIAALPIYQLLRAKKTLFGAVLVSLIGGSTLAAAAALAQLDIITAALGKDVTLTGRTVLWQESIYAIADRPLLGAGYASFWTGWFGPNHDIWLALGTFRTPHAHNGLLDAMLDLGILGGLLFAALFARGVVRAVRFCRKHGGVVGLFPLAYMALAVLASSTEHGVLSQNTLVWVLFVTTICVLTTVSSSSMTNLPVVPHQHPPVDLPARVRIPRGVRGAVGEAAESQTTDLST